MKHLITGIEGFVGGYLLEAILDAGHEVYGTFYDRSTLTERAKQNCTLEEIDIRNQEKVDSLIDSIHPDIIFHLAAQSSAAVSWKEPQLTMDINIIGTVNLLEGIKKYSPKTRVVMIGSSEEYGLVSADDNPISEEVALRPGNPYSVSKVTCEELCKLYISSYNLDIVMTRSFNHIGVRQSTVFVIADFAKRIAEISMQQREPEFLVGNLSVKRDFTDVRDVVDAYLMLVDKGVSGEVYNVGSGVSNSIQHYLDFMSEREKVDINLKLDNNRLRPSDNPVICCDNTKIRSLGWNLNYDVYATIGEMIDYWKTHLK